MRTYISFLLIFASLIFASCDGFKSADYDRYDQEDEDRGIFRSGDETYVLEDEDFEAIASGEASLSDYEVDEKAYSADNNKKGNVIKKEKESAPKTPKERYKERKEKANPKSGKKRSE